MATKNANTLQLIDGKGVFNTQGLESFVRNVRLAECGLSYAVVAIMGPQSSGKSTLMNHLFKTKFVEMDAFKGRSQTTQGVWMARAEGLDPCTLVMDLEGTDGRERGEDDTAFEKQSSLFALAVSDIVLINMWCHDIGREQAANKPLLKTVFQVMMRLFTPRRTTLLFVIRDKTRTPLETLEPILRDDIQKIWDIVPKPLNHQHTPLSEFFNVQVTALANYEEKEDQFKKQVAELRERFQNSVAPGGLAGDRRAVVPATGFPFSTQEIWKVIKENKDLDLPAHKVMVATVRCEEIADEKLRDMVSDKAWVELEQKSREDVVIGFGNSANEILLRYLHAYDSEAAFFEEGVRTAKRNFLTARVLDLLQPSFQSVLMHHCEKALSSVKNNLDSTLESSSNEGFAAVVRRCTEAALMDFDHGCADAEVPDAGWDASKTREGLRHDIETYVQSKRQEKLAEVESTFEKDLETAIGEPTCSLLDAASPDTWPAISELLEHEVQVARSRLSAAIAGFEPSGIEEASMLDALSKYGRSIVEKKAREEAGRVVIQMKDRFTKVFVHEADNMPRMWGEEHDIRAITRDARVSAVKLLAVLAALRLDVTSQKTDTIETSLMTLVGDAPESSLHRTLSKTLSGLNNSTAPTKNETTSLRALAVSTWPGIPVSDTLLSPVQCKSLWTRFQAETEYSISQALAAQDSAKRGSSWLPPPWAMCAMVVLGFNEFMTLLRNPLYIAILFVLYIVGKAAWVQLDITREFQYGFLPGIISVASKLLPTLMNVLKKLVDDGHRIGSEGSSNLNHANGTTTDRGRFKEMYDVAAREDSASSGLSENGVNIGGKLWQRQPVRVG